MTTRQCDMVNRTFALTVLGTSFVTWMAPDAKPSARLRADDSDMLRIIRMALLICQNSETVVVFICYLPCTDRHVHISTDIHMVASSHLPYTLSIRMNVISWTFGTHHQEQIAIIVLAEIYH